MTNIDFRTDVERITLPKLIGYLDPNVSRIWEVYGAQITARQIGNRCGLPHGAETYRYTVYYPNGAWAVSVRSAWDRGDLVRPLGTHTLVEQYVDLEGLHGGKWTVQEFWLNWLRAVPGL